MSVGKLIFREVSLRAVLVMKKWEERGSYIWTPAKLRKSMLGRLQCEDSFKKLRLLLPCEDHRDKSLIVPQ